VIQKITYELNHKHFGELEIELIFDGDRLCAMEISMGKSVIIYYGDIDVAFVYVCLLMCFESTNMNTDELFDWLSIELVHCDVISENIIQI